MVQTRRGDRPTNRMTDRYFMDCTNNSGKCIVQKCNELLIFMIINNTRITTKLWLVGGMLIT